MQWLKNHKYIVIIGVLLFMLIVFVILLIRYVRKRVNMASSDKNVQAFLRMIRHAEGTSGDNGYRTLFGGKLFTDYSKHPNVKVPFLDKRSGKTNYSTAAGAYQFLNSTWRLLALKLNLNDFSPKNQDLAAIELIREKKALQDVIDGNFETAVNKISKVWASMPGAGYKQPEKKLTELKKIYLQHGGQIA